MFMCLIFYRYYTYKKVSIYIECMYIRKDTKSLDSTLVLSFKILDCCLDLEKLTENYDNLHSNYLLSMLK